MRLVATEYLSLDGVFEEPGRWSGPWFNDEAGQFKWDELQASDAQLLGRKTYQGFASAWPTMEGTGDFGVKMNTMPKYVVSATLKNPEWAGTKVIQVAKRLPTTGSATGSTCGSRCSCRSSTCT